jgi:hypothetical protein
MNNPRKISWARILWKIWAWQKIAPAFFAFNTSMCFKDKELLVDNGLSPYQE